MFVVVVLGLTASMASALWSTVQQRANERDLVFVGRQFQAAIERYQQQARGPGDRYPQRLEQLLQDNRPLRPVRHLRRIYIDPMTGRTEWGLIREPDGGIVGVHSLSERKPMAGTLLAASIDAAAAKSYREWRFIAPSAAAPPASAPASAPASGAPSPP